MAEKQLRMVRRNLDGLPELVVPKAYRLRTYRPGDEEAWAAIMNTGLGEWTAERCAERLTGRPQFLPDGLFFVTHRGRPVGSACAWRESPDEWKIGIVHMVCVLPGHRSKGLGYLVTLAVLHYLRDHGFKEASLATDDFRIPAIRAYQALGFEPFYCDESHRARWNAVLEKIRDQADADATGDA